LLLNLQLIKQHNTNTKVM